MSQSLLCCCKDLGFIETWRALHPTDRQQNLEQQFNKLQREFDINCSDDLRFQVETSSAALDTFMSSEAQRSILFAKHRMHEFGNKPTKYLANPCDKR